MSATYVLPKEAEMLRRIREVMPTELAPDPSNPVPLTAFYAVLLNEAGAERTGPGLGVLYNLALAACERRGGSEKLLRSLDTMIGAVVDALCDDGQVRQEAHQFIEEMRR